MSTLQADVAATARSIDDNDPAPTATPFATLPPAGLAGTPAAARTGSCPVPEGFTLHNREGFCLAAPQGWRALNVDGGLAAVWGTTPGQSIGLQPDWATNPDLCDLTVYIAPEPSVTNHISTRYQLFADRDDIVELGPEDVLTESGFAISGFAWLTESGRMGAVYAASLGDSRLVHISRSGTECSLDVLLPVLDTMRFN